MYLCLAIKTDSLLRPLFVCPEGGLNRRVHYTKTTTYNDITLMYLLNQKTLPISRSNRVLKSMTQLLELITYAPDLRSKARYHILPY